MAPILHPAFRACVTPPERFTLEGNKHGRRTQRHKATLKSIYDGDETDTQELPGTKLPKPRGDSSLGQRQHPELFPPAPAAFPGSCCVASPAPTAASPTRIAGNTGNTGTARGSVIHPALEKQETWKCLCSAGCRSEQTSLCAAIKQRKFQRKARGRLNSSAPLKGNIT